MIFYYKKKKPQGKNLFNKKLFNKANYSRDHNEKARIISYIINNCITYRNAISNYIRNNTDCSGLTGVESLPIHDLIHPLFTHNSLNI